MPYAELHAHAQQVHTFNLHTEDQCRVGAQQEQRERESEREKGIRVDRDQGQRR